MRLPVRSLGNEALEKKSPDYGDWERRCMWAHMVHAVTSERRATVVWVLVAFAVFGGAVVWKRVRNATPAPAALADWQRPVSELAADQRRVYTAIRASLRAVEDDRARTKSWPERDLSPDTRWTRTQQRLAINYVADVGDLRWLVLFLEPDPRTNEPAPPEDDEHHTLSDGTALHVTIWTQPASSPRSDVVTAFPAAEGWVERVQR
ncbi:MAG: hypothetical protein ACO1OB_26755 [Archangium sp.]